MVGIDIFREHFKDFYDSYIIIGGVACEDHFNDEGLKFRATKDIDLVLVVEALRSDFIAHFWEFIKQGKYEDNQVEESERKYYRFIKPQTEGFPMQIELFSRKPDVIQGTDEMDLTPIPAEEELSSLSAILMDDEYYQFTTGPFLRYYVPTQKLLPYAKVNYGIGSSKHKNENTNSENETKYHNQQYGFGIGLGIPLGEKVTFDTLLGYQSFMFKAKEDNDDNLRTVLGTFGLKLGVTILL